MAKTRSPNYPAIGLDEAIGLAEALWKKEERTSVPPGVVAAAWGYKSLSGKPRTKIGAMKKYGLLEDTKDGLRLSQRALQIIHHKPGDPERQDGLRAAAMAPEIFQELYASHGKASDDALRAFLITKKQFTTVGTRQFIKAFRDTFAIANLQEAPYTPPDGNSLKETGLEVGDSVQWESQGALQFDKPRKITGFSEDRTYAFIEGSNAGIPVKQLQGVDGAPSPKPQVERVVIEPPKAGFRREVFALEGGEAILQWPAQLSAESFQDLQDWLKLILRKAERASKADLKD